MDYPRYHNILCVFQTILTITWIKFIYCENVAQGCPEQCSCENSDDGMNVHCNKQNITNFSVQFPLRTAQVTFDNCSIKNVDLSAFPHSPDLKKLTFTYCGVESLVTNGDDSCMSEFSNLPLLEVLDLTHNRIKEIPSCLPKTIRILHLSNNLIDSLSGENLAKLLALKELHLENNQIQWLDWRSFHDSSCSPDKIGDIKNECASSRLVKLSLSDNKINSISLSAFRGLESLSALKLSRNRLNTLNEKAFTDLKRLQYLDLSFNHLTDVPAEAFEGVNFLKFLSLNNNRITDVPPKLPMLEWLDLSFNRIVNVSEDLKAVIFPAEVFNIAHNPLHCDCKLLWLKELYDRREYLIKHIDVASEDFVPSCVSPRRVAGESWDNLADSVFTCDEESGDPTIYEDPLKPRSKSQLDRLKIKSGAISDTSIQVFWTHHPPTSYKNVYIQSYTFGLRSTTIKHVELNAAQQEFSLRHMRPETNYVVCVIPKLGSSDENLQAYSLDHCLELQTKATEVIETVSYMSVVGWYVLGMLGTIIFIFSCVGGVALVYGLYSSKTDWSAKYAQEVQVDAPVDEVPDPGGDSPDINQPNSTKDKTD